MANHLKGQLSPYLLQHAENPVDWYPWGAEAFEKAKREDKPVFLSIGYSSCHWCHVMAHESFEDREIADILNRYFVSVKVDREERPDVDSVYMSVCQAFTGGGGWPTSIFMTAEQRPFFAGTYFPKTTRHGATGFRELLMAVHEAWQTEREALLRSADTLDGALRRVEARARRTDASLPDAAFAQYRRLYDEAYGGFGSAPKFPAPHNLLFLMSYYRKRGNKDALRMAERTLQNMYAGGLFDHIGYGFCRYATDRRFLVPHFEKMLYDNALLILAYSEAYAITKKPLYLEIAEKTAGYLLREMRAESGAFYSAQDADSDGEEGGYYVFRPEEIVRVLGEKDGAAFNARYGITQAGNFEGKSIPYLPDGEANTAPFEALLPALRDYRKKRRPLHTDDKILTGWNALTVAALCALYLIGGQSRYLDAARRAQRFIEDALLDEQGPYVGMRDGKRLGRGFLDDYAACIFALLALYQAAPEKALLDRAEALMRKAANDFFDNERGGFYLYGKTQEKLILRPKESYDGATPSGNSLMAWNLVRLRLLTDGQYLDGILEKQMAFMCGEAERQPMGFAMFLTALSDHIDPPATVTAVVKEPADMGDLPLRIGLQGVLRVLDGPTAQYPLKNDRSTYYVCRDKSCLPPTNDAPQLQP